MWVSKFKTASQSYGQLDIYCTYHESYILSTKSTIDFRLYLMYSIAPPYTHTFRALMLMCHWYGWVAAAAPHGCFDHCKITICRHWTDVVNNIVDWECSFRTSFALHMQYWGWAIPHPQCIRPPPSNNTPKTITDRKSLDTLKYSRLKVMYILAHVRQ